MREAEHEELKLEKYKTLIYTTGNCNKPVMSIVIILGSIDTHKKVTSFNLSSLKRILYS